MLPNGSHCQGSMQCNICHSFINNTVRQRAMALFFLCFSLDGDKMKREVLLKELNSWETQTRKSIHLIFAIVRCPDNLPCIIFKTTHSFSQVAGTYIHTVPHINKPLETKIKYFFILPEVLAKEGEN